MAEDGLASEDVDHDLVEADGRVLAGPSLRAEPTPDRGRCIFAKWRQILTIALGWTNP